MSEQHGDDIAGQQTSADDDDGPPADTEVDIQDKQIAEEPLTTPRISPVYLESCCTASVNWDADVGCMSRGVRSAGLSISWMAIRQRQIIRLVAGRNYLTVRNTLIQTTSGMWL